MKKTLLFINSFFLFAVVSSAATWQVSMGANGDVFDPVTLTIEKGDVVIWTNLDDEPHTTTSGNSSTCTRDNIWDSGSMAPNETFSYTFNTVGNFRYFCTFHCLSMGMTGEIIVTNAQVSGINSPLSLELNLKSFPNPCVESATVEFSLTQGSNVKMELFDLLGNKVTTPLETTFLKSGQHSVNLAASDLKEGMYVCKLFINETPAGTSYLTKSGER